MSKAFVSSAISLLVDDEERPDVQWSTPVSTIIRDDFVLSDSSHDDACMGIYVQVPDTPKSVTRKLWYFLLSEPLRSKYQYSNVMYVVAVHMVESLTSGWFGDYIRQMIWEPLGMKDTYFGLNDTKQHGALDQLGKGYRWVEKDSEYAEVPWPAQPEGAGAGELESTALDYAAFLRCMIRQTGPISEKGHEELVKPRTITDDKPKPFHSHMLYALGWEVETYRGVTLIGHDGETSGFECKMLYLPRLDWGVVIFGHALEANRAQEVICSALVLNVPMQQRFDWEKHWKEGTSRFTLSLKHVCGEFFVAELLDVDTLNEYSTRAQFRLDARGAVSEFGVGFVEELEDLIWFRRIDGLEACVNG
ncbi:hypothetical protein D0Z07_2502 [Hyphodiscus hymeniophilus]|uniref:Beta-lactamase-related domain-containing protein n=1 Tax=Hyphodiscus hymeniophilus TaxID=353542 RepID=A0A9P7AZF6_9HELO|nr:hypothetical protein D0Z07_2502 [Hyphodiscus hymeniophilus]